MASKKSNTVKTTTKTAKTTSNTTSTANASSATPTPLAVAAITATPAASPSPATPTILGTASSSATKKVTLLTSVQALINGLQANYQPGDVFQLSAGPMTRDELIADLQAFIAASLKTTQSNAAWRSDVAAEHAAAAQVQEQRQEVKGVISARFGKTSPQMLTFGFLQAKLRKVSAKTTALAVVKREATREARGTMSKAEKQEIHGNVSAEIVVTPAGSSQAAAPVAAAVPVNAGSAANANPAGSGQGSSGGGH
jgi:hypothetical protein